ncbi:MAG TPA: flagellar assembly protein FliW [Phycisphaerales bacterium]|nr:flagellar assembly protein FliW [Phycisphaerales bacterium]
MHVSTTRFGCFDVADDRVIEFPRGLLGFPTQRRFVLLEPGDDACFFWLQSCDDPSLAFVVTDPMFWVHDYTLMLTQEQMHALGLPTLADAHLFVIVNKIDNALTGNLLGPLVVNTVAKQAMQVAADRKWSTRHPLVRLASTTTTRKAGALSRGSQRGRL